MCEDLVSRSNGSVVVGCAVGIKLTYLLIGRRYVSLRLYDRPRWRVSGLPKAIVRRLPKKRRMDVHNNTVGPTAQQGMILTRETSCSSSLR